MIRRITHRMRQALRDFRREDGVASFEFVLMVPAFMAIFSASFESGLLMTRYIMLERSLDIVVRDLRLGSFTNPTHDTIKKAVCDLTVIFPDCENILMLELTKVSTSTWLPLPSDVTCVDRSETVQHVTQFSTGLENELMLIRACAVFDPIFPGTGIGLQLPKENGGGYMLIARSAFVNEPS